MKRVHSIGLLLMLCASLLPAQASKPTISILDFQLSGISVQESKMIIDYMGSAIVETGQFRVIDRMQRESLMKEIEFSKTGCTDEACQLEIGKMLSASLIIVGSLGRIGDLYMLNLKMINVETSETVKTASSTYNSLNDLVKDNRRLTLAFLGRETQAEAPGAVSSAAPGAVSSAAPTMAAKPEEPAKTAKPEPAKPAEPAERPAAAARALTAEEIRGRDRAFWTTIVFDAAAETALWGTGIGLSSDSGQYYARIVLPLLMALPPVGPFLSADLFSGLVLCGVKAACAASYALFPYGAVGIAASLATVGVSVWDVMTVGDAMDRKYRNIRLPAGSAVPAPLSPAQVQAVETAYWVTVAGDLSESLLAAFFLAAFSSASTVQQIGTLLASALPPIGPFFTGDLASGLVLSGIKAGCGLLMMTLWTSVGGYVGGFVSAAVNIWDILAIGDAMERKVRGGAARAEAIGDALRVTVQPVYGRDGSMTAARLLAAVRL